MCGVVGIITNQQVDTRIIETITARLAHRGPDAQGVTFNASHTMAIGHTRLSILDLSSEANQPFYSQNGRFSIVFNGEIYNYREIKKILKESHHVSFRTTSDTEVVTEAFVVWGPEMVKRLEGMFSIAILDNQQNELWLFRDRIGKKPLYYYESEDLFVFASEIKALLLHPLIHSRKQINYNSIVSFLHLGYIAHPETAFENIQKFPVAHIGYKKHGSPLTVKKYWSYDGVKEINTSEQDIKKMLTALLHEAVQKRLVADVPIGAFLSGGTDSSLVTAIATRASDTPIRTFSIGFSEQKFDESKYANEVARHLKTNHTEYMLGEQEAVGLMEFYLDHFDEPFADTSAIPTMLVSRLARKDVTVALTGDGGDELFQGYGTYHWANRLANPAWKLSAPFVKTILETTGNSRFKRIAELLRPAKVGGMRSHIFSQEQYFFSQHQIFANLLQQPDKYSPFFYDDDPSVFPNVTAGEKQAIFDLKYYLPDDLLVKVDRASMAFGLECRSPLLDYNIIEFVLSLNYRYKLRNGQTKWILKQLLSEYLPLNLVHRTKWGFGVPLSKWLKHDLRFLIETHLNENSIEETGLFRNDYVQNMIRQFLQGQDYLYNRIWAVIVLQKWLKQNC